jgi:hypothetical protein
MVDYPAIANIFRYHTFFLGFELGHRPIICSRLRGPDGLA